MNAEIDASSYGTNATLTITSENNGSLQVSGLNYGIYVKSGTGGASLNINDASVVASSSSSYSGYAGVYVQSGASATNSPNISLSVDGGSLTASASEGNDGIQFYVGSSKATGATTSLTVSDNAIVDARNGGIRASGISVTLPTPTPTGDNRSGIVFDGSTGTVYGSVTLQEDLTIGEGESLTLDDGASLAAGDYDVIVDGGFTATCAVTVRPDIPPANPNYRITVEATQGGTVTADPTAAKAGATVTLTPVPDRGYQVGSVAVTDRFGDAVAVTEQADGTYTFTMPNGQVTVTVTFEQAPLPFPDVTEGDWFYDAVRCAYETGLMDGVGDNLFAPNSETTRAQLVTILYRLAGQPEPGGDSGFSDVETGTWYTDAVAWAAENGIVNGVSDTEFAPGDDITREQLAAILYRYAAYQGYDVSQRADLSGFGDASSISGYAQEALSWAHAQGLVLGFEDGSLRPQGTASRAQIAAVLMRFLAAVPTA